MNIPNNTYNNIDNKSCVINTNNNNKINFPKNVLDHNHWKTLQDFLNYYITLSIKL